MASVRRALSPVPRPGSLMNGEACQVPSPLSKPSSSQNFQTSRGLLPSLLGFSDSQALLLKVFSPRSSKPFDRSKPNGQFRRKALFHFLVCFVIGILVGFTPFVSLSLSSNLMSNRQTFSSEMVSTVGNFDTHTGMLENMTSLLKWEGSMDNTTLESVGKQVNLAVGSLNDKPVNQSVNEELDLMVPKLLIVVTPTFARPFQAYYLNRLAYTLKLVRPPLLWIVVEMTSQSEQTADILRRSGVMYRHLVCKKNTTDIRDRSVHQRNMALSHIETHRLDGIVYFADDSNIYLADLFEQIRQFRRFGTWVVGKVTRSQGRGSLEGPICNGSRVIGWHVKDSIRRFKRFHASMSGFAFNSTILWDPKRWRRPTLEPIRLHDTVRDGLLASKFIEQVVEDESQMEGLLGDCSRVMVWKLQLESLNSFFPPKWFTISNLDVTTQLL